MAREPRNLFPPASSLEGYKPRNLFPAAQHTSTGIEKLGQVLGGLGLGLFQGGSDIAANVAQFPSDIYTWATGKPGYTAPKPDFRGYGPQYPMGKQAEGIGEFLSPLLSPAMFAEGLIGKSVYGARMLPRYIGNILAGAAESDNRMQGGVLGATLPLQGKALDTIFRTPKTQAAAVRRLNKAQELAGTEPLGIPMPYDFISGLQYQLSDPLLRPNKNQFNALLGKAAEGDYPSYRALQSALEQRSRELVEPPYMKNHGIPGFIQNLFKNNQTTAAERGVSTQLRDLRQQYIENARAHLRKTGKQEIANLEERGTQDYAKYKELQPKLTKLIAGSLAGIPGYHYLKHLFNQSRRNK